MSKVTLKGFILVPDADLPAVKRELKTHIKLTLAEPGCLTFNVKQCTDNPNRFDVYEEFESKSAFEIHQERIKSSTWADVTVNVQRHYELTES